MKQERLVRARARARTRGAALVEYVLAIAAIGLVVSAALVLTAGPTLFKQFRHNQRASAAPMP